MIFKKEITNYKEISKNISVEENFLNLIYISNIISKLEYFVFFGTLLGLVREKNLIENDDDIDIYVNIKHRKKLIELLKNNNIDVDLNLKVNKSESFLQVTRLLNNKNTVIDFYFFEDDIDDLYLIEKWNFEGGTNNPEKHLRIPKIFTHPIQKIKIKENFFNFPANPEYLCEFLYGRDWNIKKEKEKDYTIRVVDGKPVMFHFKKTIFGRKKILLK